MARPNHVLFIEDEQYRNEKLIRFLSAQGLEVTVAGTLCDASAAASADAAAFGCVLLDVMLPPGDDANDEFEALTAGVDFLRHLRGGEVPGLDPALPVVVLTGRPESSVEQEMWSLGIHAFLNKPESMKTILTTIRAALEQQA
jgi:DNA-binding response OmpR family regulator